MLMLQRFSSKDTSNECSHTLPKNSAHAAMQEKANEHLKNMPNLLCKKI